jgi:putative transposase
VTFLSFYAKGGSTKKSCYTGEQIVLTTRRLDAAEPPKKLSRELGVSEATLYIWKKKFSGMGIPELRELKTQDDEIARLKRLVADLMLDKQILQDVLSKKALRPSQKCAIVVDLQKRFKTGHLQLTVYLCRKSICVFKT